MAARKNIDWGAQPLGKISDSELAILLGCSVSSVYEQRRARMIPSFYGEGFGSGIQKAGSGYLLDSVDFILFDVMCGGLWLEEPNITDVASRLGIMRIPVMNRMAINEAIEHVAAGFESSVGRGSMPAEGVVLRAPCGMLSRTGERIIAKIKTKDFK